MYTTLPQITTCKHLWSFAYVLEYKKKMYTLSINWGESVSCSKNKWVSYLQIWKNFYHFTICGGHTSTQIFHFHNYFLLLALVQWCAKSRFKPFFSWIRIQIQTSIKKGNSDSSRKLCLWFRFQFHVGSIPIPKFFVISSLVILKFPSTLYVSWSWVCGP